MPQGPTGDPANSGHSVASPEPFHRIARLLAGRLPPRSVPPDLPARAALRLLDEHGVSEVPVVVGSAILGVFSHRSFARGAIKTSIHDRSHPGDLPVEEFLEPAEHARASDALEDVIPDLLPVGAVMISAGDAFLGVATTADMVRYLHSIARPFFFLQEIELALRALLHECLTLDDVRACAAATLAHFYEKEPTKLPTTLEDMTFAEYAMLIGDGRTWRNWPAVGVLFGGTRERAQAKLKSVQAIRNDVFHFRRELGSEDFEHLTSCRDWLFRRTTIARRARAVAGHEA